MCWNQSFRSKFALFVMSSRSLLTRVERASPVSSLVYVAPLYLLLHTSFTTRHIALEYVMTSWLAHIHMNNTIHDEYRLIYLWVQTIRKENLLTPPQERKFSLRDLQLDRTADSVLTRVRVNILKFHSRQRKYM